MSPTIDTRTVVLQALGTAWGQLDEMDPVTALHSLAGQPIDVADL